ncbi:hypothetical protein D3C75_996700 [compost metagenome]
MLAGHGQGVDFEGAVVQALDLVEPVRLDKLLGKAHGFEFVAVGPGQADHALAVMGVVRGLEPVEHVEQAVLGAIDGDRGPPQ